jgi:hypothetical protein
MRDRKQSSQTVSVTVNTSILAPASRNEIFDRQRLLVDLDDATDPTSPPTVFVVIALRSRAEAADALTLFRDWFARVVGTLGTSYTPRANEICAIVERSERLNGLLSILQDDIQSAAAPRLQIGCGVVELPREACDAMAALALADRRLTEAHGRTRLD